MEIKQGKVSACAKYLELLGKITSAGLSAVFIFFLRAIARKVADPILRDYHLPNRTLTLFAD